MDRHPGVVRIQIGFEHLVADGMYGYVPSDELIEWCKENLKGSVNWAETRMPLRYYIIVDDNEDALYFKMRWT